MILKTLNGYIVNDLPTLLDQPLPPSAYKMIPGGAGLTDIDAGWQRRAFNKIFGMYGLGWGFSFEHNQIDIRHEENAKQKIVPYARVYGQFWYMVVDEKGDLRRASFPVTGANSNQSGTGAEGYTLKGAITNAIGFGASMLGWQESVYLGSRSHNNTEGFAEGKGWADTQPEELPTPIEPPVSAPVAPPALKHSYCPDCLRVFTAAAVPSICQCGSNKVTASDSVDAARRAVAALTKKPAPVKSSVPPVAGKTHSERVMDEETGGNPTKAAQVPELDPEPPAAPADQTKTLAENLGFESIRHIVCVHCGYCEPVNVDPEACSACGAVAPWSKADTHAAMVEMSGKIKAKLALAMDANTSKDILEKLKAKHGNNRGLLLQALSQATGRSIKNYSECSPAEMQKALDMPSGEAGQTAGNATPPAPANNKPLSKLELSRMVFDAAVPLKLGGPRSVIAEIGRVAGKQITTAGQLNETELLAVLENFKGRA